MRRPRPPAIAVALTPSEGEGRAALVLAYHSPRTTVLAPLPTAAPDAPALAAAELAGENPIVAIVPPPGCPDLRVTGLSDSVKVAIPGAEVVTLCPADVLRFLWVYRDGHDPLALGHASDRTLFGEGYDRRPVPDVRRGDEGAAEKIAGMLLDVGAGIGVRPPFPERGSWEPEELAGLYDTCAGLYLALLTRWGSPLAERCGRRGGVEVVRLADRWLRGIPT